MYDRRYIDSKPMNQIVKEFVRNYKCTDHINEYKIVAIWEDTVGRNLARHTLNVTFKNKKLIVRLDSAVVRQELSYLKEELIKKLNSKLTDAIVEEIQLV